VHPVILDTYLDGDLTDKLSRRAAGELRKGMKGLPPEESAVLALLHR